jgi:hypothetical protein
MLIQTPEEYLCAFSYSLLITSNKIPTNNTARAESVFVCRQEEKKLFKNLLTSVFWHAVVARLKKNVYCKLNTDRSCTHSFVLRDRTGNPALHSTSSFSLSLSLSNIDSFLQWDRWNIPRPRRHWKRSLLLDGHSTNVTTIHFNLSNAKNT